MKIHLNILYGALQHRLRILRRVVFVVGASLLLTGCPDPLGIYDDDDQGSNYYTYYPVYLSYEELRSSVAFEEPRAIVQIGRVYLFGDYFFLNEKNRGIHVFDNSDPAAPLNKGFVNIPGNTELAIRDGYLYADSYIDLVTLDLNDPNNIREVSRQHDIFPYDERQNVPSNVYFGFDQIDENRGVIIGYET